MAVAGKAAITLDGAWSATKDYDRLTGVTHNNNLYISKKKPPIGTAPAEGEYWMLCIEGVNEQDLDELAARVVILENNYFPKTGGRLTGDVSIQKDDNGHSEIFKNHSASADYGTEIADVAKDGKKSRLVLNASSGLPPQYYNKDGNGGSFYGVFNKPTANDVGALPLTGGTLSGNLGLKNGKAKIYYDESSENIVFEIPNNAEADTVNRRLAFTNSRGAIANALKWYEDSIGRMYKIFGEHNKPSGSYTGNGSTTQRTVNVGGIGKFLIIVSPESAITLVSYNGAVCLIPSEAKTVYLNKDKMYFEDGILYISSNNDYVNYSGATYNYQLI